VDRRVGIGYCVRPWQASLPAWPGSQGISQEEAATAFALARQISDRDGGKTWGMAVCGPMLFADSATGGVAANGADAEGRLQRAGDAWRGKSPKSIHIANTAIDWAGVRWTMVA
jgi:hypothetical protein